MSTLAIIDYGSGNLRSAERACVRAAAESGARVKVVVTSDPERVRAADRVFLPGVGAFADCRAGLRAIDGMMAALKFVAIDAGRPFLGVCVGMQLMASEGREYGAASGFGWIPGVVERIAPAGGLKVPHMGWNALTLRNGGHPVLKGLDAEGEVYFVHSYAIRPEAEAHALATVDYGGPIVAAVGRDNLIGVQFHPEKSQAAGLRLISNFLKWTP